MNACILSSCSAVPVSRSHNHLLTDFGVFLILLVLNNKFTLLMELL
jgi:hypothetical protein